jgi:tetratricopeptide (TPR) repeat protein
MKLFRIFVLFVALLAAGCSREPADNANATQEQPSNPTGQYTDANQALADGITLLETGETDRAIDVLNQAVMLNPDLAEAYFHMGVAYALVEARDETVVENDPNAVQSNVEKGGKPKKKNSEIAFERAVAGFKKIVAENKQDHPAWFNMGRAYNKLNEDEEALDAFREAVELNPEDSEYQTELGSILIKLARYREAIAPLKKALELDPENVEAQELLEDAEAGRSRINYQTTPKPDNRNSNSNKGSSNANSATTNSPTTPEQSNTSKPPATLRPAPARTPKSNR